MLLALPFFLPYDFLVYISDETNARAIEIEIKTQYDRIVTKFEGEETFCQLLGGVGFSVTPNQMKKWRESEANGGHDSRIPAIVWKYIEVLIKQEGIIFEWWDVAPWKTEHGAQFLDHNVIKRANRYQCAIDKALDKLNAELEAEIMK